MATETRWPAPIGGLVKLLTILPTPPDLLVAWTDHPGLGQAYVNPGELLASRPVFEDLTLWAPVVAYGLFVGPGDNRHLLPLDANRMSWASTGYVATLRQGSQPVVVHRADLGFWGIA